MLDHLSSNYAKKNMMKKEGNINFYNVFIEFYKFSVTGSPDVNPATIYGESLP